MPKQVCLLNYKKDGRPFWNQFFLAPIHDASGVVEYYLGIQSDVTEQVESARLARTHLEGQRWSHHATECTSTPCKYLGNNLVRNSISCLLFQRRMVILESCEKRVTKSWDSELSLKTLCCRRVVPDLGLLIRKVSWALRSVLS